GEYLSVQLDSNGIPHVAWSDGRNNEMDICYAHGVNETTAYPDMVTIITGSVIFAVVIILIYAIRRRSSKE
ncbi:MAG: hypothetical protein ACFFF9_14665, partial [Candidatus Thorarchaeota archaeon]